MLPAIITAGLSDSLLIIIAVVGVSIIIMSSVLQSNYLYSWFNFLDVYGLDHLA